MGVLTEMANEWAAQWRAAFTQQDRLLRLATPLGEDTLLAERLVADECIDGGGFRCEVFALSDDAALDPARLLGQPVRIDLLTQASRTALRPLHGHVTVFERMGANGGLARYRLVVEPWLAFLRHRRDSFLFQDMSVVDVIDSVFGDYRGQGKLVPEWRWALGDAAAYPKRSVITQYDESDFAFVSRLLAEEGLFYFFEHETAEGESLGVHRMVIADRNAAFQVNAQTSIRFGRADATAPEDVITEWQGGRQWQTNAVELSSWDYRAVSVRTAAVETDHDNGEHASALVDCDYVGQYGFEDAEQAQRLARIAIESLEVRNKSFHGTSTVRTLAPGTTFSLLDHYEHDEDEDDARRFVVLAVTHEARNNFRERFGQALLPAPGFDAGGGNEPQPLYRNRFTVMRATVPYRPALRGDDGRLLHPRPTVRGSQTALVVGDGGPVHTDRDHRIKVQFHWQRGGRSASRQSHPAGDDNARADAALGCWLRVIAPVAGDNWGGVALPRVGQEVVVEFVNGDIDRPVVVGAAYNGIGETDAQINRQQGGAANATGNAPAWFAGDGGQQPAYAHNAVMSGIKTQALSSSQSGDGGYNALVFDDTAGQSRTLLATTQAASALTLGHHLHQHDNAREADLGHGAALATNGVGAVRAGAGLLIASEDASVTQPMMRSEQAATQMDDALAIARALADVAIKQKAGLPGEPAADAMPALASLAHSVEVLRSEASADDGSVAVAYSEPHLVVSGAKGVVLATPADAVLVAGTNATLVAADDFNLAAGANLSVAVAEGLSLFANGHGGGQRAGQQGAKPVGDANGIAMHAAAGKVELASLKGASRYAAESTVTLASTQADVTVQAKQHVLLNAAGAQIRVLGGKIELHAPGKVEFKGAQHRFVGPAGGAADTDLAGGDLKACPTKDEAAAAGGSAVL